MHWQKLQHETHVSRRCTMLNRTEKYYRLRMQSGAGCERTLRLRCGYIQLGEMVSRGRSAYTSLFSRWERMIAWRQAGFLLSNPYPFGRQKRPLTDAEETVSETVSSWNVRIFKAWPSRGFKLLSAVRTGCWWANNPLHLDQQNLWAIVNGSANTMVDCARTDTIYALENTLVAKVSI